MENNKKKEKYSFDSILERLLREDVERFLLRQEENRKWVETKKPSESATDIDEIVDLVAAWRPRQPTTEGAEPSPGPSCEADSPTKTAVKSQEPATKPVSGTKLNKPTSKQATKSDEMIKKTVTRTVMNNRKASVSIRNTTSKKARTQCGMGQIMKHIPDIRGTVFRARGHPPFQCCSFFPSTCNAASLKGGSRWGKKQNDTNTAPTTCNVRSQHPEPSQEPWTTHTQGTLGTMFTSTSSFHCGGPHHSSHKSASTNGHNPGAAQVNVQNHMDVAQPPCNVRSVDSSPQRTSDTQGIMLTPEGSRSLYSDGLHLGNHKSTSPNGHSMCAAKSNVQSHVDTAGVLCNKHSVSSIQHTQPYNEVLTGYTQAAPSTMNFPDHISLSMEVKQIKASLPADTESKGAAEKSHDANRGTSHTSSLQLGPIQLNVNSTAVHLFTSCCLVFAILTTGPIKIL